MTDVISDMPLDDRPRERLLSHGPRTLSDAELVGILIGCGTMGKTDIAGAELVRVLARQRQERLGAYFLDSRLRILRQREIFIGTVNSALVSTRDVLRFAVEENAVSVALYHNHPSGDPQPSAQDLEFTIKMRDSLKLADIELVDHLVIGAQRFVSMKRKGLF